LAAENGHKAVIKLLLTRGSINLNSEDKCGVIPLLLAAECRCEVVVELLLTRDDVNLDPKNALRETPLL